MYRRPYVNLEKLEKFFLTCLTSRFYYKVHRDSTSFPDLYCSQLASVKMFWLKNRQFYIWLDLWKPRSMKTAFLCTNWLINNFISRLFKVLKSLRQISVSSVLARKNAWAVWNFLEHCLRNPYHYTVSIAVPASAHHITWTFECSNLIACETNLTTTRDPLSFLDILSHCFTFTGEQCASKADETTTRWGE